MVSLWFSKDKRYLRGMDWIVHVFDYMSRKITGCGHVSQIVMEMDGKIDKISFREEEYVVKGFRNYFE